LIHVRAILARNTDRQIVVAVIFEVRISDRPAEVVCCLGRALDVRAGLTPELVA
jgi:hypothetical protein